MAALANQLIRRSGLTAAFVAPTIAGDTFVPGSRVFYYAKVGGSSTTFTFLVPAGKGVDYTDINVGNLVVGPLTTVDKIIGPFPADVFADPATGLVTVTCNQNTAVTIATFELSN